MPSRRVEHPACARVAHDGRRPGRACGPADGWVAGCGAGSISLGWVERGGAGGVASVVVAVGAGPLEDPGRRHAVGPGRMCLEAVVEPAERGEVGCAGRSGLGSAVGVGVVVVGGDVVDVAAPGGAGAPGEHAGAVAEDDVVADPVRDGVPGRGERRVEVDDGLDGDLGPGVGAPGAGPGRGGSGVGLPRAVRWARTRSSGAVASPSVHAVKWAWRTTSRATGSPSRPGPGLGRGAGVAVGEEVEGGLGAGEVAECGGAAGVEGVRSEPMALRVAAPWVMARSRSRASARSRSASRCRVPA